MASCSPLSQQTKVLTPLTIVTAINDACLVFDGRLVIDANFHTNDVAIRGVGPITKFQRSYHAEPWTHANYNSKEIGIQVRPLLSKINLINRSALISTQLADDLVNE